MYNEDDLYCGLYYDENCNNICINISSEVPITSKEFFAYLNWFIHEHHDKKIHEIGEEIDMEFQDTDPKYNN